MRIKLFGRMVSVKKMLFEMFVRYTKCEESLWSYLVNILLEEFLDTSSFCCEASKITSIRKFCSFWSIPLIGSVLLGRSSNLLWQTD